MNFGACVERRQEVWMQLKHRFIEELEEQAHSETPPGENQNLFATITVLTYLYVCIFPNWNLQQSMTLSTDSKLHTKANSEFHQRFSLPPHARMSVEREASHQSSETSEICVSTVAVNRMYHAWL